MECGDCKIVENVVPRCAAFIIHDFFKLPTLPEMLRLCAFCWLFVCRHAIPKNNPFKCKIILYLVYCKKTDSDQILELSMSSMKNFQY